MHQVNLRLWLIKTLALFSVIRGYNIAMLILAQYMASLFIFNEQKNHLEILLNKNLSFIVFASALSAAAGYIINNFYDLEKDAIGRPLQNYIERFISQKFKLNTYLALNFIGLICAAFVSWRVLIFFFAFQFLVWFYSHKANKLTFINNIYSVVLMIFPFFALFIYYENFTSVIFYHAAFLFFLLLITDIIKDLTSLTADTIYNYSTIPVVYGIKTTKKILCILIFINIILAIYLSYDADTGFMRYFFLFSALVMSLTVVPLFQSKSKTTYKVLHLIFKLLIGFGIINMAFIDLNPLNLQNIL